MVYSHGSSSSKIHIRTSNPKVIGSTPVGRTVRTRIFFFRVCLCHSQLTSFQYPKEPRKHSTVEKEDIGDFDKLNSIRELRTSHGFSVKFVLGWRTLHYDYDGLDLLNR